ncbi:hypothetical protein CPB85DRAFT_1256026 [Mucidula mucida]|nr:hypothetical protein CPB85DRAFT_1256026 [Mucidula mucida]
MTFNFKQRDYIDKLFMSVGLRLPIQTYWSRAHSMRSINSLVTVGDCGQLGVKSSALCVGDGLLAVQLFPAGKEGVSRLYGRLGQLLMNHPSPQNPTSKRIEEHSRRDVGDQGLRMGAHTRRKRHKFIKACPMLDRLFHVVPGSRKGICFGLGLDKENVRQERGVVHPPGAKPLLAMQVTAVILLWQHL